MANFKGSTGKKNLIYVLAAAGSFIAIAAVAINSAWLPATFFLGITAAELGLIAAVAYVGAVLLYIL